jgi:diguanylate cyclase (GGDEF)-like protein
MMSLKLLLLIATLTYCILIGSGAAYYRYTIVQPALRHADAALLQGDMQSIAASFRSEMSHLSRLNQEWAVWDEAYQFIQQPNQAFINSNLPENTFENTRLACIAILNLKKELVYAIAYDTGIEKMIPAQHIINDKTLQQIKFTPSDNTYGFVKTDSGPALYTLSKVYDSNRTSQSNGYLLTMRKIDFELLSEIKQISHINIELLDANHWHPPYLNLLETSAELSVLASDPIRYVLNDFAEPVAAIKFHQVTHPSVAMINTNTLLASLLFLSLPVFIALITYRLFLYPINIISRTIKKMQTLGIPIPIDGKFFIQELQLYQQAHNALINQFQQQQHQLRHASLSDGLTGIANRRAFDMELEHIWRSAARGQTGLTLLLCDIDYFKRFNDSLGHQAGDEALQAVALAIRGCCRRATEFCARYGGEEFVIILQHNGVDESLRFSAMLQNAILELNIAHPSSTVAPHVTLSIGIAHIEKCGEWMAQLKPADLLKVADEALYKSKEDGRNRHTLLPLLNH